MFSTCLKVENIIIQKLCVGFISPRIGLCVLRALCFELMRREGVMKRTRHRVLRNLLLEDVVVIFFFGGRSYCWYSFFMTLAIVLSCMLEVPS